MALTVQSVEPNSVAQRLGIIPGCRLLSIDGNPLDDALDYQFYTASARFSLAVCQAGEKLFYHIQTLPKKRFPPLKIEENPIVVNGLGKKYSKGENRRNPLQNGAGNGIIST